MTDGQDNSESVGLFRLAFAPSFLLIVALFRSYLESVYFAEAQYFGYYIALHHVLWMATVGLTILLLTNVITGTPVSKLLWMLYGSVVMLIPLLYAAVVREPLRMTYLQGSMGEILLHIATFCLSFDQNRPLSIELIVIFTAMLVVGYRTTHSWSRAIGLAVCVQVCGSLLAVHWIAPDPDTKPIVVVASDFSYHMQVSAVLVILATALCLALAWRAGIFVQERTRWPAISCCGLGGWLAISIAVAVSGWREQPFDIVVCGLPGAMIAFMLARLRRGAATPRCAAWSAILWALLLAQLIVVMPLILRVEHHLRASPPAPSALGTRP